MDETEKPVLQLLDYLMLCVLMIISAGIGVYFRFSGERQKSTEEYLLAGHNMGVVPVAFSVMATSMSAISFMGTVAEMYQFGIAFVFLIVGFFLATVLTAYLTLPVYFQMNATTVYEYIDRRFGKLTRTITSSAFLLQMVLFTSVVLYAPALALSAMTNLSLWFSVISIGVVCTFYCSLGGMKAVLWTDMFQAILMYLGLIVCISKGLIDLDITEIYNIARVNERLNIPGFSFDVTTRYTMWGCIMVGFILTFSSLCASQVQVQRLMTVKNLSRARIALFLSIPMLSFFHLINCFVGITIYSYFHSCDPVTSLDKPIDSYDQLLPYFMVSSLSSYPGLPGLCICGVFSASLSTVSSAINSLTAVTLHDLLKPFLLKRGVEEGRMTFFAMIITLLNGCLCVALTFLVSAFGDLIQASLTIYGMLGGPLLAVFMLGMLTTRTNEKGVIIGLLTGTAITAWISFGATAHGPVPKTLPVSTEGCSNFTTAAIENYSFSPFEVTYSPEISLSTLSLDSGSEEMSDDIFPLYTISYVWYTPLGFLIAAIVGYTTSIIFNILQGETRYVPEDLLSPMVKCFFHRKSNGSEEKEKAVNVDLQSINCRTLSENTCSKEDKTRF